MMKTMKYYLKNILLAASCLWAFTACNDFPVSYTHLFGGHPELPNPGDGQQ